MILLKSREEIELIRKSSLLIGRTLAEIGKFVKPGVTTAFLDRIGEQFIRDNGATPVFKGYDGFPSSFCISINDEIVHGFPSDERFLEDGDIVSIDGGANLNGFISDSAYTFIVGNVKPEIEKLLKVTIILGLANVLMFFYSVSITGMGLGFIYLICNYYFTFRKEFNKLERGLTKLVLPLCVLACTIPPLFFEGKLFSFFFFFFLCEENNRKEIVGVMVKSGKNKAIFVYF